MTPEKALAWYPHHCEKWAADREIQALPIEGRGIVREMWDVCWMKGHVPATPEAVAATIGAKVLTVIKMWPKVRPLFKIRPDGNLYSEWIADLRKQQLARYAKFVASGRKGGKKKAENSKHDSRHPVATLEAPSSNRVEDSNYTSTADRPSAGARAAAADLPIPKRERVGRESSTTKQIAAGVQINPATTVFRHTPHSEPALIGSILPTGTDGA